MRSTRRPVLPVAPSTKVTLPAFPDCMMFHVVTAGHSRLEVGGAEARVLRPGDLAVVPHGEGHQLLSAASVGACTKRCDGSAKRKRR